MYPRHHKVTQFQHSRMVSKIDEGMVQLPCRNAVRFQSLNNRVNLPGIADHQKENELSSSHYLSHSRPTSVSRNDDSILFGSTIWNVMLRFLDDAPGF